MGERNRRFDESRRKLRTAEEKFSEKMIKRVNQKPVRADELKLGDRVKVLTLDQTGEILSLPDSKGELIVKIGMMKVNINVSDLMFMEEAHEKEEKQRGKYGNLYRAKAQTVSASVNVQGKILDDAVMDVDKYLDDAYMAGLKEVTVIHGRGEGILKKGLRKLFKRHKHVASYRKGGYNEGGDGVTIVTLKD